MKIFLLFGEIASKDWNRKYTALVLLDSVLEETENGKLLVKKLIDGHFVPKLIDVLESDEFPHLQLESAWILRGIILRATNLEITSLSILKEFSIIDKIFKFKF